MTPLLARLVDDRPKSIQASRSAPSTLSPTLERAGRHMGEIRTFSRRRRSATSARIAATAQNLVTLAGMSLRISAQTKSLLA
jgi:hypothetical protein